MYSLLTIWAFTSIVTALMIPFPPATSSDQPAISARGASMPTVENFTGTYLRNNAVLAASSCPRSYVTTFSFPQSLTPDVTQCADACQRITASKRVIATCRYFNMYTLFENDVNLGTQCDIYQNRWDNNFATNNGTYTPSGKIRGGAAGGKTKIYEVSNSFAYYLTSSPGNLDCGVNGTVVNRRSINVMDSRPIVMPERYGTVDYQN